MSNASSGFTAPGERAVHCAICARGRGRRRPARPARVRRVVPRLAARDAGQPPPRIWSYGCAARPADGTPLRVECTPKTSSSGRLVQVPHAYAAPAHAQPACCPGMRPYYFALDDLAQNLDEVPCARHAFRPNATCSARSTDGRWAAERLPPFRRYYRLAGRQPPARAPLGQAQRAEPAGVGAVEQGNTWSDAGLADLLRNRRTPTRRTTTAPTTTATTRR